MIRSAARSTSAPGKLRRAVQPGQHAGLLRAFHLVERLDGGDDPGDA